MMSQKMRILLIAIAIIVTVEAKAQNWNLGFNNPGFGNGRGNNYDNTPPWFQQWWSDLMQYVIGGSTTQPSTGSAGTPTQGSNVEWVCRNSKTNDMMIIASDNIPQQQAPNSVPWPNFLQGSSGHQHGHNPWIQPIIVIQGGNNQKDNQTPQPTTHNNNNQPETTTPKYHHGEGMIDIRFGKNDS